MPYRVIYACDANYAALTAISAVSLLQHNPGCEIILLGCGLPAEAVELVRSRVERHRGGFRFLDVSSEIAGIAALHADAYVSYAVYSRIFIPQLLGDEDGRVLYLDCDTLVAGPIGELFDTGIAGKPLALAPDAVHPAYKRVISLPADKPYYNSGVALIDLRAWRRRRCTERLLEELRHPSGRNPLGDQDVIIRVLNDEIHPLSRRWNYLSQYFLLNVRQTPVIYHFSGNTLGRPWMAASKHPMRGRYRLAAREAGLEQAVGRPGKLAFEYRLQHLLFRLLPGFLFRPVCSLMYRLHIRLTYKV